MILLYAFPIVGPSTAKMTITAIATRTRINAYSTKPWPESAWFLAIKFLPPFSQLTIFHQKRSLFNSENLHLHYKMVIHKNYSLEIWQHSTRSLAALSSSNLPTGV